MKRFIKKSLVFLCAACMFLQPLSAAGKTTSKKPALSKTPAKTSKTYIGSKKPSDKKAVGDVVFTDGSASPYSNSLSVEQKRAVIAVIFYVGKDLNEKGDTTTERTLGVGLEWISANNTCSKDSNGYGLCGDAKCLPIPDGNSYKFPDSSAGIVQSRNGSDNFDLLKAAIKNKGKKDDTADSRKYGMFHAAKNYGTSQNSIKGTSYKDGWFVPSTKELYYLFKSSAPSTVESLAWFFDGRALAMNNCYDTGGGYVEVDPNSDGDGAPHGYSKDPALSYVVSSSLNKANISIALCIDKDMPEYGKFVDVDRNAPCHSVVIREF